MAEFVMPTLGADMSAGTLVAWHKKAGDRVTRGEIVAEVETEKAAIDVEVFTSGIIEKLLVQPGEKVPVGTVLAIIREEGKPATLPQFAPVAGHAAGETVGGRLQPSPPLTPAAIPPPAEHTAPLTPGRLRISPSARQLAAELGINTARVKGTGPEGAITRADVEQAAARVAATPFPVPPTEPQVAFDRQARMRQTIAAAMTRSKREIPHYYLSTTIDMSRTLAWLQDENTKRPIADRLLYGVVLIKAVAIALKEVPELNAIWKEERAVQSDAIHVGVAISLRQGGLVAPALRHTDQQPVDALMRNFRDLVTRARAGSLRSSELSDPTITVTSLGEQGVETVFGVIYPPQVALVGFGKVVERPWVADGTIVPRRILNATLSADHRVSDGHRGGLFLAAIDRLLQEPTRL
jgi:pyruvate dehydrogenase E2 component (dihydrolipoamide acetyltransferase)